MEITQSSSDDIGQILSLYDAATALQASKNMTQWPKIDRSIIEGEISEGRQWKMVHLGQIVCVWVVAFEDPQIWGERSNQPSVFIHRIANHPEFRGRGFVGKIVDWAKSFYSGGSIQFIRLDTVGYNEGLIQVYTSHGFTLLDPVELEDTTGLPSHYDDGKVYLFEIELNRLSEPDD
jgi:GNAT superfamily N-acetyltransferase